jgi:hypothetical protein
MKDVKTAKLVDEQREDRVVWKVARAEFTNNVRMSSVLWKVRLFAGQSDLRNREVINI